MKNHYLLLVAFFLYAINVTSCQKELSDNTLVDDYYDNQSEVIIRSIPVSINANLIDQTKVFYGAGDDGLIPVWEETDNMACLKGITNLQWQAGGKEVTVHSSSLAIDYESVSPFSVSFSGNVDVSSPSDQRSYWYAVLPQTSVEYLKAYEQWGAFGSHTSVNSVRVNILAEQSGQYWRPTVFGATCNERNENENLDFEYSLLSSCLAVRLFDYDGVTKLTADRIVITSTENTLVGYFEDQCNPKDNVSEVQDVDPSRNGTRLFLDSSKFHGQNNTIDTGNIKGSYVPFNGNEYRFNVPANVNPGSLNIRIYRDGKYIERTATDKAIAPGHKRNLRIKWDEPLVDVSFNDLASITTYSHYLKREISEANSVSNRLKASLSATFALSGDNLDDVEITECGFVIDDIKHPASFSNNLITLEVDNQSPDTHTFRAYVTVKNKKTQTSMSHESEESQFVITGLPYDGIPSSANGWSVLCGGSNNLSATPVKVSGTTAFGDKPCIYSDKIFYIPSSINISFSSRYKVTGDASYVVRIDNKDTYVKNQDSSDKQIASGKSRTEIELNGEGQFTISNNQIFLQYNAKWASELNIWSVVVQYK